MSNSDTVKDVHSKYTLMHKNTPVVEISISSQYNQIHKIYEIFNKKHLPFGAIYRKGVFDESYLSTWWKNRSIPEKRPGISKALDRLHVYSVNELALKQCGLSLVDHYWVRPVNSSLDWNSINYFDNDFSPHVGDALLDKDFKNKEINYFSPDCTTDGMLDKRWIIQNDYRHLIKSGASPYHQEPFNEVIASSICSRLHIPHVNYSLYFHNNTYFSVCNAMTNNALELVYASQVYDYAVRNIEDSHYSHYVKCCASLRCPNIFNTLDKMIVLDYLIGNSDRHWTNFGLLRNSETLQIIGPAPIYDSGSSLWHNRDSNIIEANTIDNSRTFNNSHLKQLDLVTNFSFFNKNNFSDIGDELTAIFAGNNLLKLDRVKYIALSLQKRIAMLDIIIDRKYSKSSYKPERNPGLQPNYLSALNGQRS
jgi:hypothetical protein